MQGLTFDAQGTLYLACEVILNGTEDVAFFGRDEIPQLSITKVTPGQISKMFELNENDLIQAEFD